MLFYCRIILLALIMNIFVLYARGCAEGGIASILVINCSVVDEAFKSTRPEIHAKMKSII